MSKLDGISGFGMPPVPTTLNTAALPDTVVPSPYSGARQPVLLAQ